MLPLYSRKLYILRPKRPPPLRLQSHGAVAENDPLAWVLRCDNPR